MVTPAKTFQIRPSKAPNLPIAPVQYTQQYQDQVLNALRLYFNEVDNFNAGLVNNNAGGAFFSFPYGAFQNTTSHYTTDNTPTVTSYNQTDYSNGMYAEANDGIHVTYPGLYNYQFSVQFVNTHNAAVSAWIWLRVNGVDVAGTSSKFDVPARKSAGVHGYLIAGLNIYVRLNAGDHVDLVWATERAYVVSPAADGVYMEAYAAQTSPFVMPSVPSVIGTLTFVSS